VPEQGGYRGSGKYQFGSGCPHANWFCAGMLVSENGGVRKLPNGDPEVRVCFLPRDEIDVKTNWDVSGLAGTGSIDYEVHDRFVGPGYSLERQDKKALRGGKIFNLGIAGFGMAGHTAVALGLAKRALQEVAVIAAGRKRPHYKAMLSDHSVFRHDYVVHEASYIAARAFTWQAFGDAQEAAMAGRDITPLHVARLRQSLIYAHKVASDVVRFCHIHGGSEALRNPSVLGRCMRDMHAATQHVFVDTTHLVDVAGPILAARRDQLGK
jgi:alkylation response protein AidB-like acyl-CoA dehydrogenase